MTAKKTAGDSPPLEIETLDELIRKCSKKLQEEFDENAKLGDLLKMIELRRKLLPTENDQRKFWSMIEEVRKEVLKESAVLDAKKSESGSKSRKRTASPGRKKKGAK
jgi:hypothetical protein